MKHLVYDAGYCGDKPTHSSAEKTITWLNMCGLAYSKGVQNQKAAVTESKRLKLTDLSVPFSLNWRT